MPTGHWIDAAIAGDLKAVFSAERTRVARAATAGVRQAGSLIQNALRQQVRAAGLGEPLAKAWQRKNYPKSFASLDAAVWVYSKSKRIHAAFGANTRIRATFGEALVIPTFQAERLGLTTSQAMSAGGRPRRWFVAGIAESKYGPLFTLTTAFGTRLLMGTVNGEPTALGVLVREVRLRKRLDLEGPPAKFSARVPQYVMNALAREERRAGTARLRLNLPSDESA
ncbi:MAG: DUF6441 family protein [Rhodospirillaceae bacterium]|nr:DUF6441 family protein [Rhodospirillaceae bacterium]